MLFVANLEANRVNRVNRGWVGYHWYPKGKGAAANKLSHTISARTVGGHLHT